MEKILAKTLEEGVIAHRNGNFKQAAQIYQSVLQSEPTNPEANHNLGILALETKQTQVAQELFQTAIDTNPKVEQFWLSLLQVLIQQGKCADAAHALQAAKKNGVASDKLATIETHINSKLCARDKNIKRNDEFDTPSPAILNNLLALFQQQHLTEAETLARKIISEFPNHPFGWKVLSALLGQANRMDEALITNQKAVALSPDDPETLINLGITQNKLELFDEAEISFKDAIKLKFNHPDAHNNLGTTLHNKGKFSEAKESFLTAININPKNAEAYNNLAISQKELGLLDDAEESYRKAISIRPSYAQAHNNLGNTLAKLKRLKEAEASYRLAIHHKPNLAEAHNNLGVSLQDQGQLENASESFSTAISLDSNYAEAHNNLGVIYKDMGRLHEAQSSFDRALMIKPDFAEAHSNLAGVLKTFGSLDEAEASFRQALSIKPDSPLVRCNLGTLLFERGEIDEARKFLEGNNDQHSQSFLLKCLYEQDDKASFFALLDTLIGDGRVDPTMGSLTARSEIKFGIKKQNVFVSDPFKYVSKTDLNERCDFFKEFVLPIREIIKDQKFSCKTQGLLTKGEQTAGNFFSIRDEAIQQVENIIRAEIERYKNQFANSQEGFLKSWPNNFHLNGWLVHMKSGGQLAPHMHEDGWLSGAAYINVPPKETPDSGNFAVCIDDNVPQAEKEANMHDIIDVMTGDLVLFPSSMMHYTIPFESEEDRIVLAFDMNPLHS